MFSPVAQIIDLSGPDWGDGLRRRVVPACTVVHNCSQHLVIVSTILIPTSDGLRLADSRSTELGLTSNTDTNAMRAERDEFCLLLKRVQTGSQDAVCELIERYSPHVVRAVRRRLSKAIRAKFDSVDFVQAVWASFFAAPQKLTRFRHAEDLLRYLAALAYNKVVDEVRRRMQTEKYNIDRERSLDDSALHLAERIAGQQPSPSEVALANELWARLLDGLPEHHQQVLELRLAGNTQQQIAEQLGLNERTVRRVIRKVIESRAP